MKAMLALQWRTARFELVAVLLATVAAMVAAWFLVDRLHALAPTADCVRFLYPTTESPPASCPLAADFLTFQADTAGLGVLALSTVAILAGALLGSQLVSREIERRTAVLAWTADPSRGRWFVERVGIAAAVVALIGFAMAAASEPLVAARYPGTNVGESFTALGSHGVVLGARGIMAFALGVLIGSIAGRTVPALIATIVVSAAVVFLSSQLSTFGLPTRVVADPGGLRDPSALYVDNVLIDSAGRQLTFAEAHAEAPASLDPGDLSDWIYSHYIAAAVITPGTEAPTATTRDIGVLTIIALAAVAAGWLVVSKRRPV